MLEGLLTLASGFGEQRGLLILTYHRTLAVADTYINDVTGNTFAIHAEFLRRHCNVLRLDRAAELLAERSLPPRSVAITFDDGFRDNIEVALPILKRTGLPATFFVASGYLDGGVMWNDVIIDAVRNASDASIAEYFKCDPETGVTLSERVSLMRRCIGSLKYQDPAGRNDAAVEIARQLNVGPAPSPMMTRQQVRQLAQEGMEVGAHTVTHPILTQIDTDAATKEILDSRSELEEITGHRVTSFAYPNGRPCRDFDATHVGILREHGFGAAVTTGHARATCADDRLELPRISLWQTGRVKILARLLLEYRRTRQ